MLLKKLTRIFGHGKTEDSFTSRKINDALRTKIGAYIDDHYADKVHYHQFNSNVIDHILRGRDAGFSEKLLELIDASGKTDAEIYKKANVDRRLFSKIRSNKHYKPAKNTALALAIALELDLYDTRDLIGRAGYTLSPSLKFDLIIEYFIKQGNYDIFEINEALYDFGQDLLGG